MSATSGFPAREDVVLRYALARLAQEKPDKVFAMFDGGPVWTRAELLARVRDLASSLEDLGVKQGDNVVCWLPNGPEVMEYFFAINYLGAVFVPINTAYRGGVLSHVLSNSDATLMIADAKLIGRLAEIESRGSLARVVAVGLGSTEEGGELPGIQIGRAEDLPLGAGDPQEPREPIEPWHTQAILYTSGTTGPSKGVLSSYMQAYSMFGSQTMPFIKAEDRILINMPFYHVGGATLAYGALLNGGSVAVVERFSGERFWDQIRDTDSTMVFLLGVMAAFVERREPSPMDSANPLAKVFMVPLVDDVAAFSTRFGVDVITIYNMTELSAPIISEFNPTRRGTCGKARLGVEVRLVDHADREVPLGDVGEIVIRTDQPFVLNHGYYKMPDATAAAWRNGWFHTGDSARQDSEGYYYFVDRMKDAIRRRGENISSIEVETEILTHPDVREVAVVAVPSEIAEDEVLAIIAPIPGRTIDPEQLIRYLEPRMAYYMVPRYIRIVDELPKTETAKVQKAALRQVGLGPGTWDRQDAGVRLTR